MEINITDIKFLSDKVWHAKFNGVEYSGCGLGNALESFCNVVKIYLKNGGKF